MSIRLSCNCIVENYDEALQTTVKSYTREGNKALLVGMYCIYCRQAAEENGEVLETVEQEIEWMESE